MISQFFILSPRGDTVITRDYLGNVPKVLQALERKVWSQHAAALLASAKTRVQGSSEVFYRKVRFWDGEGQDAPPVFHVDGVNYLHVKV